MLRIAPWMDGPGRTPRRRTGPPPPARAPSPGAHVGLHELDVDAVGELVVAGQWRVHAAGGDGVDPQVGLGELHGQCPGQLHDGTLGHAVHDGVRLAHQAGVRRQVDDVAGRGQQVGNGGLGQEEAGVGVDGHHLAVLLHRDVGDVVGRCDAGDAAQDVEPSQLVHAGLDRTPAGAGSPRSATWVVIAPAASPAASSRAAASMSTPNTWAPSATSCSATARPMPEPAPVMSATFPSNRLSIPWPPGHRPSSSGPHRTHVPGARRPPHTIRCASYGRAEHPGRPPRPAPGPAAG